MIIVLKMSDCELWEIEQVKDADVLALWLTADEIHSLLEQLKDLGF